ncbi:MAG: glycine cleavage system protein GcvH [Deltaproteobacteria bacterium]|nr:glycine cleavage system protein GcvH [Deltaproteobacteria bacterium]
MSIPAGLKYTKDHEWAKVDGNKYTVGITAFAVGQLGDITLVNIDVKVGDAVTAGKAFGTIESVKTLSDLYAPVTGKVLEINKELEGKPELVNEDCYGKGWMIVFEASGGAEGLMDETAYDAHVKAS